MGALSGYLLLDLELRRPALEGLLPGVPLDFAGRTGSTSAGERTGN